MAAMTSYKGQEGDESNLDTLNKALEARQKILGIEEKILAAMDLEKNTAAEIAKQTEKTLRFSDQVTKAVEAQQKAQEAIAVATAKHATQLKTMVYLGGLALTALEKQAEMSKLFSDNTRSTATSLGLNVNESKKMNKEINAQIKGYKMGQTTLAEVVDMQTELNDAYGGAVSFTAEQATNMSITSQKLGISTKQAAGFSKLMFMSGEASGKVAMNLLAGIKTLSDKSGVKFAAVMNDISTSGEDMMSYFGKSGKEIAIMAVQARKMGFELSDMQTASEGLLDVETRIEKQMKFNMLTGRNINLDKATALMLQGKEGAALKEIVNQVGNIDDLKAHELAALKEATGLDITKLKNAEMLREQNEATASAAADIADVEAQIRAGQLEEFALKEIERSAAKTREEERVAFEDNMANKAAEELGLLDEKNNMALIFQGIQLLISGAMAMQAASSALQEATDKKSLGHAIKALPKLLAGAVATMGRAVGTIFASLGQIPFGLGLPLAIGAVAGLIGAGVKAKSMFMNDGVIEPGGGMVVQSEKGSIQLNKDDSIIAGTNLGGGKSAGGGSSAALIKKMDELISAVKSARVLNVDGYKLNEALHLERVPSGI